MVIHRYHPIGKTATNIRGALYPALMGASQDQTPVKIDDTRWKIGWSPLLVIFPLTLIGALIGWNTDNLVVFSAAGLLAGLGIWYLGVQEVNSKYPPLLDDFQDTTRKRVADETGGITVNSMYTFVSPMGDSPPLIKPAKTYSVAHLIFGDTSLLINKAFQYDMENRTTYRGGEQSELFYDQISNVQSENYSNYATLQVSLSSGEIAEIPSRDPQSVEAVKSELQENIRAARRQ